jgi:hypothetical protein
MTAHRRMTNLILTHMAEAWGVKTPGHAKRVLLQVSEISWYENSITFSCVKVKIHAFL